MTGMTMEETTTAAILQAQAVAAIIPAADLTPATIPARGRLMAAAQGRAPMTMIAPEVATITVANHRS